MCREDIGCFLAWKDFVPGRFCPGNIFGVYLLWKILGVGRFCAGKIMGVNQLKGLHCSYYTSGLIIQEDALNG